MKCNNCGTKNDPKSKFCRECGMELTGQAAAQVGKAVTELFGKEVEVLFFTDSFTGKVSGIVRPSEEQIHRYPDGILQRIRIEAPGGTKDENVAAILKNVVSAVGEGGCSSETVPLEMASSQHAPSRITIFSSRCILRP